MTLKKIANAHFMNSPVIQRCTLFLLLLLSLGCFYLFVSDLFLRITANQVNLYHKYLSLNSQKKQSDASLYKRIKVAEARAEKVLSMANYTYPLPSFFATSGRFYFVKAMQQTEIKEHLKWLEQSHKYWIKAHKARPFWPYYSLPLLQVEILMGKNQEQIQKRMDEFLKIGKNEAALQMDAHKVFIKHWSLFSKQQQQWFIKRLGKLEDKQLKERYVYAKKVRNTGVICNFLAWNKAKKVCL